jgi:hypothetical protein
MDVQVLFIPLVSAGIALMIGVVMLVVALRNIFRIRRVERRATMQRHPSTWQDPHVRTKPAIDLPLGPRQ